MYKACGPSAVCCFRAVHRSQAAIELRKYDHYDSYCSNSTKHDTIPSFADIYIDFLTNIRSRQTFNHQGSTANIE